VRPAFAGHGLGDGTPGGRQQDAGSLWRIGEQSASGGGLRATRGHTLSATRGPGHRSSPAGSQSGSSCFPCPFYASEMPACPGRTQVSATTRRPYSNPESHRPHGSSFHAVNGDWIALDRVAAAGHFGDDASHGSRWTARHPTPVKSLRLQHPPHHDSTRYTPSTSTCRLDSARLRAPRPWRPSAGAQLMAMRPERLLAPQFCGYHPLCPREYSP
jgi:hypothetical protein